MLISLDGEQHLELGELLSGIVAAGEVRCALKVGDHRPQRAVPSVLRAVAAHVDMGLAGQVVAKRLDQA
jgi:hypothetical protein